MEKCFGTKCFSCCRTGICDTYQNNKKKLKLGFNSFEFKVKGDKSLFNGNL